jgi:hypothetical protein
MSSVGRNEPCPCGSGRRYKSCHGQIVTRWNRVGFVVAGTQKGGTTALASYLGDHPEICMPGTKTHPKLKELHHFDDDRRFTTAEVDHSVYHSSFEPRATHKVMGEATPIYMYWESAPRRMLQYNPAMKVIILLRNPVSRAYSHWTMEMTKGRETLSFEEALRQEPERLRTADSLWRRRQSYVDRGYYSLQLARIWQLFPREQTLLLRSEALRSDPVATLGRITDFLGIGAFPRIEQRTVLAIPYQQPMSGEARAFLQHTFAGEIDKLEKMLGWDLSGWRSRPVP